MIFPLPLEGYARGLIPGMEKSTTSPYMNNVRPRDTLESWIRLGQRPGLKKAYSQQIGGAASPIVWVGNITTVDQFFAVKKDYYITGDDDLWTFDSVGEWLAQTFTPSLNYNASSVKVKLYRAGDPGNLTISLRATSAGVPTGSDLEGATAVVDASTTFSTGTSTWVTFELSSTVPLTAETMYAVVIRESSSGDCKWWMDGSSPTYSGGASCVSGDGGNSWNTFPIRDFMFEVWGASTTVIDKVYSKTLIALGNNEAWHESSAGTMTEFTDANGDFYTSLPLSAVEAYGKLFIANGSKLKVLDKINSKISTDDAGANETTKGMVLTGATSGATMVVDYANAVTDDAAALIYGKNTSNNAFVSGETVAGTNGNNEAVSFVLDAAEDTGPHWYDWTVFGNDTTTYGTMPSSSTLVELYRGRLVLNDNDRPHAWHMTKIGDPYKIKYDSTNDGELSAVTYAQSFVGEIGDILTTFIRVSDDLFIFGCQNSIWVMVGDPLASGQIAQLTGDTGVWGSRSYCLTDTDLYFLGNDGLYRCNLEGNSISRPENISKLRLPTLISDLDLDKSLHRVVLAYDPEKRGVLICKSLLSGGTNSNYWFSLTTQGFFPETYPDSCGIFSACYYPATDETYKDFLVGCQDGYIRKFDNSTKNDTTTSSTSDISSYVLMLQRLGQDDNTQGLLRDLTAITAGGAANGDFSDTDSLSYSLYKGEDAETVLEDVIDGATAFKTGSWSGTGKQNRIRLRMRDHWMGIKLSNNTASETWALNSLNGTIAPKGKV